MIIIETNRIYSIYTRTNKRIQWRYADYQGRWETPEKAIEIATQRVNGDFEYIIEDMEGNLIKTGYIVR